MFNAIVGVIAGAIAGVIGTIMYIGYESQKAISNYMIQRHITSRED